MEGDSEMIQPTMSPDQIALAAVQATMQKLGDDLARSERECAELRTLCVEQARELSRLRQASKPSSATSDRDGSPVAKRRDNLVRLLEVKGRTGLSRTTIYRRMGAGTFPKAEPLSPGMIAWYENDIDAWIENPMGWRS
jgi:prophage regulatory protein